MSSYTGKDFVAGVGCKRRVWPPTGGLPSCVGERIFISGGETAEGIVGDTWWSGSGGWHRDFESSNGDYESSVISTYASCSTPSLRTLSADLIIAVVLQTLDLASCSFHGACERQRL